MLRLHVIIGGLTIRGGGIARARRDDEKREKVVGEKGLERRREEGEFGVGVQGSWTCLVMGRSLGGDAWEIDWTMERVVGVFFLCGTCGRKAEKGRTR